MSKNNIFKQLQTIFFSEIIATIVVKFHMKHDWIPGFQNCNIRSGQESKMVAVAKNSKNNKINFFSRTIWYSLVINLPGI